MYPSIKDPTTNFNYQVKGLYSNGVSYLTSLIPSDLEVGIYESSVTHKGRIIDKALKIAHKHKENDRLITLDIVQK